MKVTLDFEITKVEEDALSSVLFQGKPLTEHFLRDFCRDAITQAVVEVREIFLYDSVITPVFEEENETD